MLEVHPVMVRSAEFCIVCSFCMLVGAAIGYHTELAYSSIGLVIVL